MKVLTIQDVHIRENRPSREARRKGVVFKDFEIDVERVLPGESIEGNDVWYQDRNGDFLWSGGTTRIEEVARRIRVGEREIEERKLSFAQRTLGVTEIWQRTTGEGVRVAVIDSGILNTHVDFGGSFQEGFNARSMGQSFADIDGHGTHCAGVIAAGGAGEMIGVAPGCDLFAVKMINRQTSGFSEDAFERAMDWAIQKKVHVVSLSLGTDRDPDNRLLDCLEKAALADILVVAAIGNEGEDQPGVSREHGDFPAVHPECISVGALNDDLTMTAYTSRFSDITICAPGNNVHSTWIDGGYRRNTCTSIATPFVAGVAALLRSKRPDLKADAIRDALVNTALEREQNGLKYRVIQPLVAFNAV